MFNIFGQASKIRSLSQEDAKKKLNEDKDIILLDVRTPEEYKEKHIPNSILLPLDTIKRDSEKKLTNKEATIFVYCRSGGRSATAVATLANLGYTNVYNIGGIMTWPYETEK
ncbi:MAG: rhodanese-like domain-containing protein [Lutisporaceae bacterium]